MPSCSANAPRPRHCAGRSRTNARNLYITEELQGGISEADQFNDEAKIEANRKKEEELLKKAKAEGLRVVDDKSKGKKPTPAEAAAPAPEPPKGQGPEPTIPKPAEPPPIPAAPPEPPPPITAAQEPPDDIDMSSPTPPADGPPAESAKPWASHVIKGLKNPKFFDRAVGDLSPVELQAIESQWLPKVRQVWDQVNPAQKADAEAFEAAIAFSKMEKPWT